MTLEQPLFLKNEKWYKYNEEKFRYELTEEGKQNPEVVKSFNKFYEALDSFS